MKICEAEPQVSPEDEQCNFCVQEGRPLKETIIPAFEDFHFVVSTEGLFLNLCNLHFYEVATLQ